jgi:hypothetical protein
MKVLDSQKSELVNTLFQDKVTSDSVVFTDEGNNYQDIHKYVDVGLALVFLPVPANIFHRELQHVLILDGIGDHVFVEAFIEYDDDPLIPELLHAIQVLFLADGPVELLDGGHNELCVIGELLHQCSNSLLLKVILLCFSSWFRELL